MKLKLLMLATLSVIIFYSWEIFFAEPTRFNLACSCFVNIVFLLVILNAMWDEYRLKSKRNNFVMFSDPHHSEEELNEIIKIVEESIEKKKQERIKNDMPTMP